MSALGVLAAGFGGIGTQDHQSSMYLPALAGHESFDIVGVVDVGDAAGAAAASEQYGVRRYDDLAQALADPAVEVVSLAAPFALRATAVATVLEAGKHVLADKPLAGASAEIADLAERAATRGLALVPAHYQRLQGVLRSARVALRSGRIGLPWNLQADFLVAGGDPAPDGELTNLAVHPIDAVHALLGLEVVRVHACGGQRRADGGEDPVTLLLDHEHGVTSTITCGRLAPLAGVATAGLAVHRYRVSGSHGVLLADALKPAATVLTSSQRSRQWAGPNTMHALLDIVHSAVLTGRSELGAGDALHAQQVVEAAQRSLDSGRPMPLGNDPTGCGAA
jgi:predicted dehydrogenase